MCGQQSVRRKCAVDGAGVRGNVTRLERLVVSLIIRNPMLDMACEDVAA